LRLSRPALGPTHPPVQWVPSLPQGVKNGRAVTLTTHLLLVPLVMKEKSYASTPSMGRTACTEPQCLYKGALYLTVELCLYSLYVPYGLYSASVPVQGRPLHLPYFFMYTRNPFYIEVVKLAFLVS
jgi:hypothetical protein